MKIEKSENSIWIEFSNGFCFEVWECLREIIFFRRYNWNTWQFIKIEFENDRQCGHYEFNFVFMCCGIRIMIPNPTPKSKEFLNILNKQVEDIKSGKAKLYTSEEVWGKEEEKKNGQRKTEKK